MAERHTLDQLHHDVRFSFVARAVVEIVNGDDVRVPDHRSRASLATKAFERVFLAHEISMQDFDGHFIADPLGRGVAGAGFSATLRDMARFGQLLLDDGRVGDEQLLPPGVVSSLLAGGDPEVFARNPEFAPMGRLSYKSQWYVFNGRALLAIGIHGQQLYVDFETRLVSVKQASPPHALSPVNADSLALMHALSHHYREGST